MDILDFLNLVSAPGYFCVVVGDEKFHKVFNTPAEAIPFITREAKTRDVFFCVHSLREPSVWNPNKRNKKTGEMGAFERRTQANMLNAKTLFLDLDVGDSVHKYPTQKAAAASIIAFAETVGLKPPTLVNSGYGVHVYWPFTEDIETDSWVYYAALLNRLIRHYDIKADPLRIRDQASLLRIPGTINHKRGGSKAVKVAYQGDAMAPKDVYAALWYACEEAGLSTEVTVEPKKGSAANDGPSNIVKVWEGKTPTYQELHDACPQVQEWERIGGDIDYPRWYLQMSLVRFCEPDGREHVHRLSSHWPECPDQPHPNYSYDICEEKLGNQEDQTIKPARCATIDERMGNNLCDACPHRRMEISPITAMYRPIVDNEPPDASDLASKLGIDAVMEPPELPKPYEWLKAPKSGVGVSKEADSGKVYIEAFLNYKMFPIERQTVTNGEGDQTLWCVDLPIVGSKLFIVRSDELCDAKSLMKCLGRNSVYVVNQHAAQVQAFMSAYTRRLQELTKPENQYEHFGWVDNKQSFIIGHRRYCRDGTIRPVQFTGSGEYYASKFDFEKAGDLETQVAALKYFEGETFIPHQFALLASLGSALLAFTQYNGVQINLGGPTGGGKSALAYCAMSMWGHPKRSSANAIKSSGMTDIAIAGAFWHIHSMMFYLDEISGKAKDPEALRSLAYSVSQGRQRDTAHSSSVSRKSPSMDQRHSILMTSINGNLHALLAQDSNVGDATAMRIIDIPFKQLKKDPAAAAKYDAMFDVLCLNCGHIGEKFIQYVLANYDWVIPEMRKLQDGLAKRYDTYPSERYQVVTAAAVALAGTICRKLGLLTFDVDTIVHWFFTVVIPRSRNIVAEEYISATQAVVNFFDEMVPFTVTMPKKTGAPEEFPDWYPPNGNIKARYEREDGYLFVTQDTFKQWCQKRNYPHRDFLEQLELAGVVYKTRPRKQLTTNTHFAGARSYCLWVNAEHEAIKDVGDRIEQHVKANVTQMKPVLTLVPKPEVKPDDLGDDVE
jgi:hypothetical protein